MAEDPNKPAPAQPKPAKQPDADPKKSKGKGPVFTGPRLKKRPGKAYLDDQDARLGETK